MVVRSLRPLPVALVRHLPPVGWWLLKRLPRRASEWFLFKLMGEIYREFSEPGVELDDDLLAVLVDPAVEWIRPSSFPDSDDYRGHSGVRREIGEFIENFSEFRSEVRSVALDPERETLFVTVKHRGRGVASGAHTDLDEFHLYRIRHGRVWRLEMFTDHKAALEARYRQPA